VHYQNEYVKHVSSNVALYITIAGLHVTIAGIEKLLIIITTSGKDVQPLTLHVYLLYNAHKKLERVILNPRMSAQ
jgi:uncharacterized membrane protein YccF (DUF307 family)